MSNDGKQPLLFYQPPEPQETEYRVGLCSWQDKSMIEQGKFYPRKTMQAEERLWWYSQYFDTVEVNSTFYAPLSPMNAVMWAKRTPDHFLFNVKAYALLTGHHLDAVRLPVELKDLLPATAQPNRRGQFENQLFAQEARDWAFETFRQALIPLQDTGKLGYVLFQFAPWVKYGDQAMAYLESLPARLPGVTIAVEFRDRSWIPEHTDEVLHHLAQHGISYVSIDAPVLESGVPPILALTSPVAVLRLHGRNTAGYLKQLRGEQPAVAEKYDYLYSKEEITELADKARGLRRHARRVYVGFNNNHEDFPAINGMQLVEELLGRTPPDRDALVAARRKKKPTANSQQPSLFTSGT